MKLLFLLTVPMVAMALPVLRSQRKLAYFLWLIATTITLWHWYSVSTEEHDISRAFGAYFALIASWPIVVSLITFFTREWWSKLNVPYWGEFVILFALHGAALIFFALDINKVI